MSAILEGSYCKFVSFFFFFFSISEIGDIVILLSLTVSPIYNFRWLF